SVAGDVGSHAALACPLIAKGASPSASISACRRRSSFGPATHVLARAPDVSPTLATANTLGTLKATSVRADSSSDVVLSESSDARPMTGSAKQSIAPAVIASEAKQSILPRKERMDCFAALAMTTTLSRRDAPEPLMNLPPKEGVGNAGCPSLNPSCALDMSCE